MTDGSGTGMSAEIDEQARNPLLWIVAPSEGPQNLDDDHPECTASMCGVILGRAAGSPFDHGELGTPTLPWARCRMVAATVHRVAHLAGRSAGCHLLSMEWRTKAPAKRPGLIEPCIPTRASKPPVGPQWVHEIKHDGSRLIARKRDSRVQLFTRNGFDWTERYPLIRAAVASLRASALVIDGEAVFCDGNGVANLEKLHSRGYDALVFLYAFDLLELCGLDLRPLPLEERKGRLQHLLSMLTCPGVQLNEHIEGDGATIFEHACRLGFEGIVSKHRDRPYRSGPSKAWLKIKNPAAPGVLRFVSDEP
jgi:bifunctional non-homologous end joining protein LigD